MSTLKGNDLTAKIEKLAKAFSKVLYQWIPEDMPLVIERNKTDEYKKSGLCASHDFCDSNMAMDEAFTEVIGRGFIFYNDSKPETEEQNEKDTATINAAWTLAKKNDFYNGKFEAGGKPLGSTGLFAKGGKASVELPGTNLWLSGFGIDTNGNSVVKVGFPNDRAFSIQTNGNLPETHNIGRGIDKLDELRSGDLKIIAHEVYDYVSEYGSTKQKSKLKKYSSFETGGKPLGSTGLFEEGGQTGEWIGTDANLEESLHEYGFVMRSLKGKEGMADDEYGVLFKISDGAYDYSFITVSDMDKIINGEEWADEDYVKSFLETVDVSSKEEWFDLSPVNKLGDLLGHWGFENIFGSSYSSMTKKEADEMIGVVDTSNDDLIDFIIPTWAMSAIVNGDYSGLDDAEEEKLKIFIDKKVEKYGNANFMLADEGTYFSNSNDIDGNLGGDVEKMFLRPSKEYAAGGKPFGSTSLFSKGGKTFKIGDIVYNKKFNTVGIVRLPEQQGELKTDADGNVDVKDLFHYDPKKHSSAKIAPSTKNEMESKDKVYLAKYRKKVVVVSAKKRLPGPANYMWANEYFKTQEEAIEFCKQNKLHVLFDTLGSLDEEATFIMHNQAPIFKHQYAYDKYTDGGKPLGSTGLFAKGGTAHVMYAGHIKNIKELKKEYGDFGSDKDRHAGIVLGYIKSFPLESVSLNGKRVSYIFGGAYKKEISVQNHDLVFNSDKEAESFYRIAGALNHKYGTVNRGNFFADGGKPLGSTGLFEEGGNISKWIGGTACVDGCYTGKSGFKEMVQYSKKYPKNTYIVTDDNYFNIGNFWMKDGVFAKIDAIGNPSYDFDKHKVKLVGKDDVIYKFRKSNKENYYAEGGKPLGSTGLFAKGGTTDSDTPKIYVADLAAYNEGNLVGEWLDLSDYSSGEEIMEAIHKLLKQWSKKAKVKREEYAIHDAENIPKGLYSEYMGESTFDTIYEYMKVAEDTNIPLPVLAEWVSDNGADVENAADAFQGEYDDMEDYAYQLVEEGAMSVGNNIFISDTDRRIISGEEADRRYDDIDDEDELINDADLADELTELEEKRDKKEELEERIETAVSELTDLEEEYEELQAERDDKKNKKNVASIQKKVDAKGDEVEEKKNELVNLKNEFNDYDSFDFDTKKTELSDKAKEKLKETYSDEVYESLKDPIEYFVEEQGIYTKEELVKQSFIQVDYEALGKELSHDYSSVEHDGKCYVFSNNYAKGGSVKPKKDYGSIVEGSTVTINAQELEKIIQAGAKDKGDKKYWDQFLSCADETGKVVIIGHALVKVKFSNGVTINVPKSCLSRLSGKK